MMGMGQQMPMRRPPMGPSPMTAGRPNPMAGFQGGPQGMMQQAPPAMGGGYGNLMAPRTGAPPPGWQQHNNVQGVQANPNFQGPAMTQGSMGAGPQFDVPGGGQFYSGGQGNPQNAQQYAGMMGGMMGGGGGPQGMQAQLGQMQGGMSDAQMHPFAPRNRPQFPGAMQGGIMGGMAPGMTPPWMRRQYQGL